MSMEKLIAALRHANDHLASGCVEDTARYCSDINAYANALEAALAEGTGPIVLDPDTGAVLGTLEQGPEPCPKCSGGGGGHVRRGDDDWEYQECAACCGTGSGAVLIAATSPGAAPVGSSAAR